MVILQRIKSYFSVGKIREKSAAAAYDLWSGTYDAQPNNLMLHLDESLFSNLLNRIDLKGKTVIDIGCGTGRHWPKILSGEPKQLIGYDISDGMLTELKRKFSTADVEVVTDNVLSGVISNSVDVIISTLTIAHLREMEEVFEAWARVLRFNGDIIITDFHPALLEEGGKRDFHTGKERVIVKNYVHSLTKLNKLAIENDLQLVGKEERFINEKVKSFYEKQNALHIYERFKGRPVIYGLHFKKQ